MKQFFYQIKYGTKAVFALISINIAIFLFSILLRSIFSSNDIETGLFLGGSSISPVLGGQIWRLITANFLHLDIIHILFNVIALYYYGGFIENFYSSKKLFIIYVITGISGTMLSLLNISSLTFGASAAVWGFIGVTVGNYIKPGRYSPKLPIDVKHMMPSLVLWLLLGFGMPGISGLGHFGGFIGGILLGMVLNTANDFSPSHFENKVINFSYFLCIFATIASFLSLVVSWFT